MDYRDSCWGLYRDYYGDPFPDSAPGRETSDTGQEEGLFEARSLLSR